MRWIAVPLITLLLLPLLSLAQATGRPGSVPAYSYCAHWYARSGSACINDAKAGSQVAVVWDDAGQMQSAISHCKSAGCKISFYCEAMYTGAQRCDISGIASTYGKLVSAHGANLFLPMLEIDAIAEIPKTRAVSLVQAMKQSGFSLVLKNSPAVKEFAAYVPVARVVYEDIAKNGQSLQEFKQLAQNNPTLLLTGIVHQGAYGGDPGASAGEAAASFKQLEQFKNVELFFGMPSSYKQAKAFDGNMQNIAEGVGGGGPTAGQNGSPIQEVFRQLLSGGGTSSFGTPSSGILSSLGSYFASPFSGGSATVGATPNTSGGSAVSASPGSSLASLATETTVATSGVPRVSVASLADTESISPVSERISDAPHSGGGVETLVAPSTFGTRNTTETEAQLSTLTHIVDMLRSIVEKLRAMVRR